MTIGDPEPQIERMRELSVTGDLEQLKALIELETGAYNDPILYQSERVYLRLLGPVTHGASLCWLLPSGRQAETCLVRKRDDHMSIVWCGESMLVSPDMTLQQIYDQAIAERIELCLALHLGLLRAVPLPHGCLRLLFAVAGFEGPSRFWHWVDGLTAELHRLDFRNADSGQAAPAAAPDPPPKPAEPQPGAPLDHWFDWRVRCQNLHYKVTLREIATKAGYAHDTVKKKHALYMAERRP